MTTPLNQHDRDKRDLFIEVAPNISVSSDVADHAMRIFAEFVKLGKEYSKQELYGMMTSSVYLAKQIDSANADVDEYREREKALKIYLRINHYMANNYAEKLNISKETLAKIRYDMEKMICPDDTEEMKYVREWVKTIPTI